MKRYFTYKKDTGIVGHVSEVELVAPAFEQVQLTVDNVTLDKIESNKYELKIVNDQLAIRKTKKGDDEDMKTALLQKIDAGEKIKIEDITPFLKELLTQ